MSAIPFLKPHFFKHTNIVHMDMSCKAEVLKGVVGLSHLSSGELVKAVFPPLCSSQGDSKYSVREHMHNNVSLPSL